jgi:hypothetical protein
VLDWRRKEEKEEWLKELLAGRGEEVLVWSEAGHQKAVGGRGRDQLRPANTLVVWTAPPSAALLREGLRCVGPKLVVLVGADPEQDEPQAFLERLAGLAKFAIRHRGGQATWEGLAAATSQTEVAVQLGLEWLVQRGQLVCEPRPDGGIQLALSQGGRSSLEGEAPLGQLERVLAETAAYRAFFMRAEKPVE